jgi:hypothetical protein
MTEAEWLDSPGLYQMFELLRDRISDRKLRLFGCACCRRIWSLISDDRSRKAVEVAERYAEGLASREERDEAYGPARVAVEDTPVFPDAVHPWVSNNVAGYHAAFAAVWLLSESIASWQASTEAAKAMRGAVRRHSEENAVGRERSQQADLLRDIVGNPFRPPPHLPPSVLAYQDGLVVRLATASYAERSLPDGHLDPARLAVLADALEEAGLADASLLGHLRSAGPHVRGDWAVDVVLGRL